jgi:hypothetical protein
MAGGARAVQKRLYSGIESRGFGIRGEEASTCGGCKSENEGERFQPHSIYP